MLGRVREGVSAKTASNKYGQLGKNLNGKNGRFKVGMLCHFHPVNWQLRLPDRLIERQSRTAKAAGTRTESVDRIFDYVSFHYLRKEPA